MSVIEIAAAELQKILESAQGTDWPFLRNYVFSGGEVTTAGQTVTVSEAIIIHEAKLYKVPARVFTATLPNTTYQIYFDGTLTKFMMDVAYPTSGTYQPIATVVTDAAGTIIQVVDTRGVVGDFQFKEGVTYGLTENPILLSDPTEPLHAVTKRYVDNEFTQRAINVKQFGAKGDGVTDDTTAINAALTAVESAGGGTVYFPKGVYIITAALLPGPNTILKGEGGIKYPNIGGVGTNGLSIIKAGASFLPSTAMIDLDNAGGCEIVGLAINGGDGNRYAAYGIHIHNQTSCITIDDCLIECCGQHGIYISTLTHILKITRSYLCRNLGYGLWADSLKDSQIETSFIFSNGDGVAYSGGGIYLVNSGTLTIQNTRIEWNNGYGLYDAGGTDSTFIRISDCFFDTNYKSGIRAESPKYWYVNASFSGNGRARTGIVGEKENLYINGGSGCIVIGRFLRSSGTPDVGIYLTGSIFELMLQGSAYYGGETIDIDHSTATLFRSSMRISRRETTASVDSIWNTNGSLVFARTETGDFTFNTDLRAVGGYKDSFSFFYNAVSAGLTNVDMEISGGLRELIMNYPGSVLAIGVASDQARTAGTLTVSVTKNGEAVGLTATLDATNPQKKVTIQNKDTSIFVAGDLIGVHLTTSSDWATGATPANIRVVVTVEI